MSTLYKLSASLSGHSQDVRAVASPSPTVLLSASRDSTAIVWTRPDDKSPFNITETYKVSDRFVNAVAYIPPSAEAPKGKVLQRLPGFSYMVTGSQDCLINVYIIGSGSDEPAYRLIGHSDNVCSLNISAEGLIISGSWDRTARVWKDFKALHELRGHELSVLAAIALTETEFLTASADKTIRLWDHHKQVRTFTGHTDAVRGLTLIPEIGFASCSNDGDVRVWTVEGDSIFVLSGHTSFVYSVAALPNGDIVSSGEDRTVRVWRDGESSQVGEMTDGVGATEKKTYMGKEWDYVFEVDVQEGAPKLKLPYNANENPYVAAQRFLGQNDLPVGYLDQVVKFIEQQTGGVNIGSSNEYVDPFTGMDNSSMHVECTTYSLAGASRYQPASSGASGGTSGYSDPFTGATRYQPSTSPYSASPTPPGTFSDPFTGASRYAPPGTTAAPSPSAAKTKTLPIRWTLPFRQCNVPAMRTKLLQLNDALKADVTVSVLALSKPELGVVERVFSFLQKVSGSVEPSKSTSELTWPDFDAVLQILTRWPEGQRFPLIDLVRLLLFFAPLPAGAPPNAPSAILEALLEASNWNEVSNVSGEQPMSKSWETNVLLVLRAFANCLQVWTDGTTYGAGNWIESLVPALNALPYERLNKAQRLAYATLLLNISCVGLANSRDTLNNSQYQSYLLKAAQQETSDSETAYRALAALGNVVGGLQNRDSSLLAVVEALPTRFPEDRMRTLAAETKLLLTG
ncbi:hypothetical protein FRC01_002351 [Tulasnella sp. 417]|nr:hypothetical protein FRC01_002351 [Tulasnella sp. 417]